MKNIIVKTFAIVIAFIFVIPFVVHANTNGLEGSSETSTIYVHDLADLLTSNEEEWLIEKFKKECEGIHYNILFLTTNDSNGKSTMTYSDDYMDELFPSYEHNIAFIIDMDNREVYVNTMGNAILCLTDNMIDMAIDQGYDSLVDGEYADCFEAMADYCVARLNDDPGQGAVDDEISNSSFIDYLWIGMLSSAFIAIAIAIGVMFFLIVKHNKSNKRQSATTYVSRENYNVLNKDEIFVRSYETVQHDYYKPSSSSSGSSSRGGGSSHRSSSGRSHGGGGRKF